MTVDKKGEQMKNQTLEMYVNSKFKITRGEKKGTMLICWKNGDVADHLNWSGSIADGKKYFINRYPVSLLPSFEIYQKQYENLKV